MLVWQVKDIGSGFSTPSIVGERNYLLSNRGLENEFVQALAVKDGKPVWNTYLGKVGNPEQQPNYPAARSTPTVDRDVLYALDSDGDLACVEFKTGTVKWEERGIGTASLCFADGRLYLHGENGEVALVEATPDGYREKGRFTPAEPPDRGSAKAWAYPVVCNGRLYIRDIGTLWCYDVKE